MCECQFLIASNIEHSIQYRAQDIHRTVFVITVFVLPVIVSVKAAVRAVLVAALETLLEIVLVLVPCDVRLVAVCSAAVNIGIRPSKVSIAIPVGPAGLETLSVPFVNGVLKKLCAPVVRVVKRTVAVNTVTGVLVPIGGSKNERHAVVIACVVSDLALLVQADLIVIPGPGGLTLLHQTGALQFGFRVLLVRFRGTFHYLALILVIIAIALCASYATRSDNADQYGRCRYGKFSKITCIQN